MVIFSWLGDTFMNGISWILQQGVVGLIRGVGGLSRFMTEYCSSSFTLFAAAGFLVVIVGGKEKGMKMVHLAVVTFIIMKILGGTL